MAIPYTSDELFSLTDDYDIERLRMYLENGGDPNIRDEEFFLRNGYEHPYGNTPLIMACDIGNKYAVRLLVENGADVNAQDNMGLSSLHMLCTHVSHPVTIAALLIENGADIEIKDQMGSTPLLFACVYGNMEMVKLLVDSGADIHTTDMNGDTCLHSCDDVDIIHYLLEKGLDPNTENNEGNTPVYSIFARSIEFEYFSDREKNMKILFLLIEYGCNLFIKNDVGKTMIDYCPFPYIKEELIKACSDIECSKIKEPSL